MHFGEYELSPSLISLSPLPSTHPEAFQRLLVRSSSQCYLAFNLVKGRSLGFASTPSDQGALLRLAFASAADLKILNLAGKSNSQVHYAKGTPSQHKAAPTACRRMVSGTISLFYSKCFSPFLHSTGSLSVSREYLALPDGPGRFTQNFSCSALLRIPLGFVLLRIPGCHRLWLIFPDHSSHKISSHNVVLQPHLCRNKNGLGYSPFARHYQGNHYYFLFLQVLRCFSSLRQPPSQMDNISSRYWVVPFGNLRIKGHLHLPEAYRSLSRPSSPPRAKASAMRPCLLSFKRNFDMNLHIYVRFDIYFQLFTKNYFCTSCQRSFS